MHKDFRWKELHQKGDVSLQQKRTSLVPDALLDLEAILVLH